MECVCGRSPDNCRGWHSLSEEDYQNALLEFEKETTKKETIESKPKPKPKSKPKAKKDDDYEKVKVTEVHHYSESVFRLRTSKPSNYTFRPGEFTMLGLGDDTYRAYSFASSPTDDFFEFYSIKVPDGEFTSKLKNVQPGDSLLVKKTTTGTLIENYLTPKGSRLWLMATGTGIAPFISMLRHQEIFAKYESVIVTWSVRKTTDLQAYKPFILNATPSILFPTVTQDVTHIGFTERIQNYLTYESTSVKYLPILNPELDRVLLCGNVDFNDDLKNLLEAKGFTEGSSTQTGTYLREKAFARKPK